MPENPELDKRNYTGQAGKFVRVNATEDGIEYATAGGGSFSGTMDDIPNGSTYVKTHNDYTGTEKSKLAGIASGATANSSDATLLNVDNHVDGTTYKKYSSTEKTKLSGIASGATANDTDANLKNRDNHTGTQTASTISDFDSSVDARITGKQDTLLFNESVTSQSPFSSDTYLTGSVITFLSAPVVGSQYKLIFDVTKTAAGTATPIINIRIGTNGTTADTARLTFTFGAGTAAVDTGIFEVLVVFRTVGSGTSAVVQGITRLTSNLTTTGLSNAVKARVATSAGFNSTTASLKIGASYNGGASAAHTIQLVQATYIP